MKRFLLLYNGPPPSPPVSHEGWPEWFDRIGDALVDVGSPAINGLVVRADRSTTEETSSLNGFSLIQASDRGEAVALLRDHPLLALGGDYAIELFEVPRK